jgi:Transposase
MQTITTIGLDIAKSVFQVHGVDAGGQVIVRRQLKRRYVLTFFHKLSPCLIGIEACGSSHHWSRELQALGHTVRLIPPAYVKPYVKRQKNDATDAEAICEAVTRANMRFRCAGRSSRCRGTAHCRRRSERQASSGDRLCVSLGTRGSIAQDQGADPGVRPADQGLAPIQRDEHEARRSSRRRSGAGHCFGRCRR